MVGRPPIGDAAMTPAQRQQRRRDKLRVLRAPEGLHAEMFKLLDQLDQMRVDLADRILGKLGTEIAKRRRRRQRELAKHRRFRRLR